MKEPENRLLTVNQFVEMCKGGWPASAATVRAIIFDAARGRNKFHLAFKRIGRRVLVDPVAFWHCADQMQKKELGEKTS